MYLNGIFFSFFSTPLEQFEIIKVIPFYFPGWDGSITNSAIFILIAFILLAVFLDFLNFKNYFIKSRWEIIFENIYNFIKSLISENIGKQYYNVFILIFFLFNFLLISNLIGMVPYTFTVTSHLILTFTLSFAFFLGINIIGVRKHGFEFFGLFLPSGAPLVIAPFLIIIELISYIARVFSLAIRLFANMMSGHTLLNILAGFGWAMFTAGGLLSLGFIAPTAIVFIVTGLELAIAGLQAYVFSVLVCIYLNDAINLH